jgi:hypothetical protein
MDVSLQAWDIMGGRLSNESVAVLVMTLDRLTSCWKIKRHSISW